MKPTGLGGCLARVAGVLAVVAVAGGAPGCASTSTVHIPEDKFAACQRVQPETADSHWAVLAWYADVYADPAKDSRSAAAARVGIRNAEAAIRSRWASAMAAQYPFLSATEAELKLSDPGPVPAGAVKAAIEAFDAGIVLQPQVAEARRFAWIVGLAGAPAFAAWATGQPHQFAAKTDATAGAYDALSAAFEEKAQSALAGARELAAAQKYAEAVAALRESRTLFARTARAPQIGDAVKEIAPLLLLTALQALPAEGFQTIERNHAVTRALLAKRQEWLADADTHAAFATPDVQAAFVKLQHDLGQARGLVWQGEMQALAEQKRFWKLYRYQQAKLKETADTEAPTKAAIHAELWAKFQALLPLAFQHFTAVAQDEIAKGERHGAALILYGMVREIADFVVANQPELAPASAALVKDVGPLEAQSQKFAKLFVSRKLFLHEIQPKDGLGTELKGDLEAEFGALAKSCPLLYGLSLGEENAKVTPKDYVMTKGIYATLEAVYSPEHVVQENITLVGEVEEQDNPKYLDAVQRGKKTVGLAPKLYTEKSYQYTVNRKTTEAVATARLGFTLEYEDRKDSIKINLSEALKRTFVQEAIDPNLTKRLSKPVSAPPAAPREREPKPPLRGDRVLTLLEMKEWARGETKKLTVMRLLGAIAALPLELEARAAACEKDGNWPVAANFRGLSLEYCRNVDVAAAAKSEFFCHADPPAYLKDDYVRNTKLVQDITALKEAIWAKAVDALVQYVEKE